MDGEVITPGQSSQTKTSLGVIRILVVDDDSTSLTIIAGILKRWKYEVLTVKHPADALSTLRTKHGLIDLVVTDVHMPDMNGFQLQKQIDQEFKLPVIMISADDKESVMLRGLEGGAVFFMLKPINPDDLKNIWQYAVAARKGKFIAIEEEADSVQVVTLTKRIPNDDRESASSVNDERGSKKEYYKRKPTRKGNGDREESKNESKIPKKAKVVWTTTLHNRFLYAIGIIGLEKAVPKRILEFMNIPGLTRENIASHLQKFRIFLKRVTEATNSDSKNSSDRAIRSNFASGPPSLIINNFQHRCPQSMEQQQMRSFQSRFGVHIPFYNAPSLGPIRFPNDPEASSSNSITQIGYGQSHLLRNQANVQQPILPDNTNHLYQANCPRLGILKPNDNIQTDLTSRGGTISSDILNGASGHLMNGINTMPMYPQQTQARPEHFASGPSSYNFRTSAVHSHNGINPSINNLGSFDRFLSFNNPNNNYAGIQMTSGGDQAANGVDSSYHDSMNEQMESGNLGYFIQGVSSSVGFESENNQFSPAFTNVIQQENYLVRPPPPAPPPLQPQGNSIGHDEGELTNYIFGPINNTSTVINISPSQPFGGGDLSNILLKPINDSSPNQQQGDEEAPNPDFTISSYHVEENPQEIVQTLDQAWVQQEGGAEVMGHEFDDQSNDYFPLCNQFPNQQQVGEEFVNSELYGTYQLNMNTLRSHISTIQGEDNDEIMDFLFGNGAYLWE